MTNQDFLKEKILNSNTLIKLLGKEASVRAILNEVYSGNPPIREIKSNCKLEMKFL